jgi:hypothetical protein
MGHGRAAWRRRRSVRISVDLAIPCHMSSASTNTADDVCGVVALFRTVVFAMADATTVLADLVFVVTESSVQGRKLA